MTDWVERLSLLGDFERPEDARTFRSLGNLIVVVVI